MKKNSSRNAKVKVKLRKVERVNLTDKLLARINKVTGIIVPPLDLPRLEDKNRKQTPKLEKAPAPAQAVRPDTLW